MQGRGAGFSWNLRVPRAISRAGGIRKRPGVRLTLRRGLFRLFLTGNLKIEVQAREGFNSSALKSKPPGGPRGAGLVSQHSYRFIHLGNQSPLPLKVFAQYTTLLRQAFYGALSLRSLSVLWSSQPQKPHDVPGLTVQLYCAAHP